VWTRTDVWATSQLNTPEFHLPSIIRSELGDLASGRRPIGRQMFVLARRLHNKLKRASWKTVFANPVPWGWCRSAQPARERERERERKRHTQRAKQDSVRGIALGDNIITEHSTAQSWQQSIRKTTLGGDIVARNNNNNNNIASHLNNASQCSWNIITYALKYFYGFRFCREFKFVADNDFLSTICPSPYRLIYRRLCCFLCLGEWTESSMQVPLKIS